MIDPNARRTLAATGPLAGYLRRVQPFALIAAPDHANLIAVWAELLSGSRTRLLLTNHTRMSMYMRSTGKLQEKTYPRRRASFNATPRH